MTLRCKQSFADIDERERAVLVRDDAVAMPGHTDDAVRGSDHRPLTVQRTTEKLDRQAIDHTLPYTVRRVSASPSTH